MNSKRFISPVFCMAACTAGILAMTAPGARAQTVIGGNIFVTTSGDVMATYLGNSANDDDYLFLQSPTNSLGNIFFNHGDAVGTVKDLGFFTAGTELTFGLYNAATGYTFFSGDASLNPDDHAHARVTYGTTNTLVEFEDLDGGPYDYNDLSFSFTNVQQSGAAAPEPGTFGLLGFGAVALIGVARRRRAGLL